MLPVEEFEDTKEAIRIRILKKNKQHNGQKKNNDLQNIQRSSNTNPLKTGGDLKCSGRVAVLVVNPFHLLLIKDIKRRNQGIIV